MEPFRQLEGVAVALPLDNVDTDQIVPARFLKVPRANGFGGYLFHDLRLDADGRRKPGFPLDECAGARILVARHSFGVGSSREAAVWALVDFGIRCVVATSFGDIFAGNAVNNGLLAASVSPAEVQALLARVSDTGRAAIDLDGGTIRSGDLAVSFEIDPVHRVKLLNGWDDLDLTQSYRAEIDAFAARDGAVRPWAAPRVGR